MSCEYITICGPTNKQIQEKAHLGESIEILHGPPRRRVDSWETRYFVSRVTHLLIHSPADMRDERSMLTSMYSVRASRSVQYPLYDKNYHVDSLVWSLNLADIVFDSSCERIAKGGRRRRTKTINV